MSGGARLRPQDWFSAAEIAALGLPALPDERGIRARADREAWRPPALEGRTWRKRKGRGGGFEYHVSLLPIEAQAAIALAARKAHRGARSVAESAFESVEAIKSDLLAIGAAELRIRRHLERIETLLRNQHQ